MSSIQLSMLTFPHVRLLLAGSVPPNQHIFIKIKNESQVKGNGTFSKLSNFANILTANARLRCSPVADLMASNISSNFNVITIFNTTDISFRGVSKFSRRPFTHAIKWAFYEFRVVLRDKTPRIWDPPKHPHYKKWPSESQSVFPWWFERKTPEETSSQQKGPYSVLATCVWDNPTSNLLAVVTVVTELSQGWDVLYWIVIILYRCCNKLQATTRKPLNSENSMLCKCA